MSARSTPSNSLARKMKLIKNSSSSMSGHKNTCYEYHGSSIILPWPIRTHGKEPRIDIQKEKCPGGPETINTRTRKDVNEIGTHFDRDLINIQNGNFTFIWSHRKLPTPHSNYPPPFAYRNRQRQPIVFFLPIIIA
ncbi:hypothetical protein CDAR_388841 [Caerostris darwini]|uniref:Uncharacterized protein n=1 Tax=Caerostris darwini TaxID=1538125 RepID=A0AAV4S4C8_9ARAC|nr:hypothetical protein CDAR_388841 [Caerostris darwini]